MRNVDKLPRIKSRPFPHVVVKNFLDSPTLDLVIDALAGLEYDFKESDLFSYWASVELTDINHPAINILRDDLGGEIWRKKVAESFKVKKLSSIDMAAYVYGLGDFLLPHDDGNFICQAGNTNVGQSILKRGPNKTSDRSLHRNLPSGLNHMGKQNVDH